MSPTPLAATDRYVHAGETAVYWVASIATISTPTRGELDAATDLTGEVAGVVGWRLRSAVRDVPHITDTFTPQVMAELSVDASDLVFYASRAGAEVTALLSRGTVGHVVFLHGGDVEGNPMEVWPVRVASTSRAVTVDSDSARIVVQFVVTSAPAQDVPAPGVS